MVRGERLGQHVIDPELAGPGDVLARRIGGDEDNRELRGLAERAEGRKIDG